MSRQRRRLRLRSSLSRSRRATSSFSSLTDKAKPTRAGARLKRKNNSSSSHGSASYCRCRHWARSSASRLSWGTRGHCRGALRQGCSHLCRQFRTVLATGQDDRDLSIMAPYLCGELRVLRRGCLRRSEQVVRHYLLSVVEKPTPEKEDPVCRHEPCNADAPSGLGSFLFQQQEPA